MPKQSLAMRGTVSMALAAAGEKMQPTFAINAYNGGAFRPDSPYLECPMVIDLSGADGPDRISAILDHDDRKIVGQTDSVKIGRTSIDMSGTVTGPYETEGHPSWEVVSQAKGGYVWPVSLGASIEQMEYVAAGNAVTVNGQTHNGPVYVARRIRLRHISFLSDGADQTASARIAARAAESGQMKDFHDWLSAKGFDPEKLDDKQRVSLRAMFDSEEALKASSKKKPAIATDDDEATPPTPKRRARSEDPLAMARAKRDRRNRINELAGEFAERFPEQLDDIEMHCRAALDDEDFTPRDFENQLLRETSMSTRVDNRLRGGPASSQVDQKQIEAALCMAGGLAEPSIEKQYGADTMTRVRDRWSRGLTLVELLTMAARANGWTGDTARGDIHGLLMHAMPPAGPRSERTLRASSANSTYAISGILSNVMNKFLLDSFNSVDLSAMQAIRGVKPVKDFKQASMYTLAADLTYKRVSAGGEIKHGTFGETSYTNQADTFGIMLGIGRKDLINDDLGALQQLAELMGRGGAEALLSDFWTTFINNTSFFTSGRNAFASGTDTVLSSASLTAAKVGFRRQTQPKPDGTAGTKPLNIPPAILLVPPELESMAKQLINSQLVVATTTADTERGNANIHAGSLQVVVAPELSNSSYTGYSTKKWYLLAAPQRLAVIQTVFLNGVQVPTVENAQADFNVLGIQMRGYFDFGNAQQEYRAGYAMKGEA